ncbi:MAG: DUF2085 domain-containing protein [Sandaracinaceae bacterium]|nr:DUF2085 domain-containing protein [Sandaracinaceae bacterium]
MTGYALLPALLPDGPAAASARWVFSGLCHQEVARSFAIDGHPMAVCHRCAGIYAGLAVGALLALALRLDPGRKRLWLGAAAPIAVQVLLGWIWPALDLWWLRVATGLATGALGGLLLATALATASPPTTIQ